MLWKRRRSTISPVLGLALFCVILGRAWATGYSENNLPSQQAAVPQSQTLEFARQAGAIAGVAQACGQNTMEFTQRVTEAVHKMAINPADATAAIVIYQQVARVAQINAQKTQHVSCTQALQDYHNLPIMQADYKEKVLPQLTPARAPSFSPF